MTTESFAVRSISNPAATKIARLMEDPLDYAEFSASSRETGNFSRRIVLVGATLSVLLFLAACSNQGQKGSGQHASVLLRDGTTVTGTVTASSATEITLTGDDSVTHTVPMAQVKSIEYDDATAAGP